MTEPAPAPFSIIKGRTPHAWKVLLYGTPGCGKSTLATSAPRPLFLDLEGGLDRIDCERTPRLQTLDEIKVAMRYALTEGYKTVVIDTIDEVERILSEIVCQRARKPSLAAFDYGKGHELLLEEWKAVVAMFDAVKAKGTNVFLIGHEQVKKFEDPAAENYDKYLLKMHQKSAAYLTAKMDAVLFARYQMAVKEREGSGGQKRRAVGDGSRVIHTAERPCWIAKNRFGLPETIPMDATLFDQLI
jgi:hypothetical protein